MSVKILFLLRLAVFCALLNATAQEPRQLSVVGIVQVEGQQQEGGFAISLPVKCSPNGGLYMNFAGSRSEPGVSVLFENGKHLSWFGLNRIADSLNHANILDFAVGTSHDVFFMVSTNPHDRKPIEYSIIKLKEDGSSQATKLEIKPGFFLRQIALLGSEKFVISGFFIPQAYNPVAFVATFDAGGRFMRRLTLSGDLTTKDVIAKAAPGSAISEDRAEWVDLSSLQTADDGRVYLARNTPEGPIFLISEGGAVQRLALQPPEKDAALSSVKVNNGRIAAEYKLPDSPTGKRKHSITVTDLLTGQVLQTINYEGGPSTGVGMVCYREQKFEFLTQDREGHLQVVRAVSN